MSPRMRALGRRLPHRSPPRAGQLSSPPKPEQGADLVGSARNYLGSCGWQRRDGSCWATLPAERHLCYTLHLQCPPSLQNGASVVIRCGEGTRSPGSRGHRLGQIRRSSGTSCTWAVRGGRRPTTAPQRFETWQRISLEACKVKFIRPLSDRLRQPASVISRGSSCSVCSRGPDMGTRAGRARTRS